MLSTQNNFPPQKMLKIFTNVLCISDINCFDKTKMWLKIASKREYVASHTPLLPCHKHCESAAGIRLLFLLPPGWHLCIKSRRKIK